MEIKELRKRLGWTQRQLAIKLEVADLTISRWERNLYRPSKSVLVRLNRLVKKADNGNKPVQ